MNQIEKSPLQELDATKPFKPSYTSEDFGKNRLGFIKEFFEPCLKNSVQYWRYSAFYNSEILIYLFQGIKPFINNGGKIKLLLGSIPDKDFDIANDEEKRKMYEEEFINRLLDEDEFPQESNKKTKKALIQFFAWLIDTKRLKLKLGFILNERGKLANKEEVSVSLQKGMLHDKIGVFIDEKDNKVGFRGSLNETIKALFSHDEGIDVHKSWDIYPGKAENEHLQAYINKFNRLWKNKARRLKVYKLPDQQIIKIKKKAPKNKNPRDFEPDFKIIDEFYSDLEEEFKKKIESEEKKEIDNEEEFEAESYEFGEINDQYENFWEKDLPSGVKILDKYDWEHQTLAPNAWETNNYLGLFEMATGTGKTVTAIKCMYKLFRKKKKIICWIVVPDKFLIHQWAKKLAELTNNIPILKISSQKTRKALKNYLSVYKLKTDKYKFIFFLSTTRMIEKNIEILQQEQIPIEEILVVIDEAHSIGAPETRKSLIDFYPVYRIGLTATPRRYFDPIGTEFIENYFDKTVYELSLQDALDKGLLTPYNYFISFCELTSSENEEYEDLTRQILLLDKEEDEDRLVTLYNLRADIIKKAEGKKRVFENLIKKLIRRNEFNKGIVYCDDHDQLEQIRDIINRHSEKKPGMIDGKTPNENREEIIELLENKHINVILAMKCLDQGVDIPFLKFGIFLSSSGNEKEFIQRRGRLMRRYPKKDYVRIYDILVKKRVEKGDEVYRREKARINHFYQLASNKVDVDLDYFDEMGDFL